MNAALSTMPSGPALETFNVHGARALAEAFPGLAQVACFDSSFHRTMPEVAQIYALPKDVRDGEHSAPMRRCAASWGGSA